MNERIERLQRRSAGKRGVISLSGGLPATAQFPRRRLAEAFLRAVDEPSAMALQYGWPEGSEPLRAFIAARLRRRGAAVDAEDVIVTSGAQQAIAIAAQLALKRGERVGVDAASYPAALDLFRTRGAHLVSNGHPVRARYVMPALNNPRGVGLGEEARAELLASRVALIEDDAYAELRFDGPPPRPLVTDARSRVWHIGTFSKTLCPGLRVGWLVPPPALRARALRHKRDLDLQANSLAQAVLVDYFAREDFDARLERLRAFYRARAMRLADAVARHLPRWRFQLPEGGFSLWVETGEDADDTELLDVAIRHGVSFDPGRQFRATGATRPLSLRLCYSAEPGTRLEEGVRRLAKSWAAFGRGPRLRARP